jgi:hypothetical protein
VVFFDAMRRRLPRVYKRLKLESTPARRRARSNPSGYLRKLCSAPRGALPLHGSLLSRHCKSGGHTAPEQVTERYATSRIHEVQRAVRRRKRHTWRIDKLASAQLMRAFVRDELLPRSLRGECAIITMRGHERWKIAGLPKPSALGNTRSARLGSDDIQGAIEFLGY